MGAGATETKNSNGEHKQHTSLQFVQQQKYLQWRANVIRRENNYTIQILAFYFQQKEVRKETRSMQERNNSY